MIELIREFSGTRVGRIVAVSLLIAGTLMPGIAKLLDEQWLFAVGVAICAGYFFLIAPPDRARDMPGLVVITRSSLIVFALYAIVLGGLLYISAPVYHQEMEYGVGLFVVPIVAVGAAGTQRCAIFIKDLRWVGVAHVAVSIALYPPVAARYINASLAVEKITAGAMAFRLVSVSGSLAFSTLLIAAFSASVVRFISRDAVYVERITNWFVAMICALGATMTLQRAAWLGLVISIVVAAIVAPKARKLGVLAFGAVPPLVMFGYLMSNSNITDLDIGFVVERWNSILAAGDAGAIGERTNQWANVLHNLRLNLIGFGPGQIGQPVRELIPYGGALAICDGDPFRIVSEYGLIGVTLMVGVWCLVVRAIALVALASIGRISIDAAMIAAAFIGISAQSLGTNVTELYFSGFIFWALVLLNSATVSQKDRVYGRSAQTQCLPQPRAR